MLRGKTGKTILVQFADQMVQFDTIIFCRTFKNYFGQFVWIETSRDRPKSAPYQRLKNSKKTFLSSQVFFVKSVKYSLLQYSKIENFTKKISKKLHTQKNGLSGASGPTSASPWRAERGTLPSTFLSQLKGEPFGEKTNFRIKVSQCRKTARGTLWGF